MLKILFKNKKKKLTLIRSVLKWYIYSFLGRPFPLLSVFYLTNKCNFKCKMCNIWRNPKKSTIPIEQFKQIVDDLSEMGCYFLSFTGGEPLLLNDLFERIAYSKSKIPYFHMVTNGYLLDEKTAQKIAELDIDDISISLDGNEKTHDDIRGVNGAYDKVIKAIKNIKKYSPRTKITINTVISPYNLKDLYFTVSLAEQLGVYQKFQPINTHPVMGEQITKSDKWEISEGQIKELEKFVQFIKKKRFIMNSRYFLEQIPNYFSENLKKGIFIEDCKLPYFYCEFNEKGELFPCLTAMDWKEGFHFGGKFKNFFYSKIYKEKQKDLKKCRLCQRDMYICYLEPRITFPITKYLKYTLFRGNYD